MTSKEIQAWKKRLLALEAELSGSTRRIEPNRTDEAEVGGDEDEQPLNEMLQSIASNRNKNAAGTLTRVRAALAKLNETPEDFGLCEDCGDEIAGGRLSAMPYAELCVGCQAKAEGPRGGPTRKTLTDFR